MYEQAEARGARVWKQRGDGVTVTVLDLKAETVIAERAAKNWPEVYALAHEYGVPRERIHVDGDEAREILGPRPDPSG